MVESDLVCSPLVLDTPDRDRNQTSRRNGKPVYTGRERPSFRSDQVPKSIINVHLNVTQGSRGIDEDFGRGFSVYDVDCFIRVVFERYHYVVVYADHSFAVSICFDHRIRRTRIDRHELAVEQGLAVGPPKLRQNPIICRWSSGS